MTTVMLMRLIGRPFWAPLFEGNGPSRNNRAAGWLAVVLVAGGWGSGAGFSCA